MLKHYDKQNTQFLNKDRIGTPEFSFYLQLRCALGRHGCGLEDGARRVLIGFRTMDLTGVYDLKGVKVKGYG